MPAYDYACEQCGHLFELRQSFTDDPISICPECGGRVRRLFSAPRIIFKGSGWYINDSKSANATLNSPKSEPKGGESKGDETKGAETVAATEPGKSDEKAAAKPAEAPTTEVDKPSKPAKPSDKS
jgi:putative FmdB family regulatory protein